MGEVILNNHIVEAENTKQENKEEESEGGRTPRMCGPTKEVRREGGGRGAYNPLNNPSCRAQNGKNEQLC